MVDQKMAFHIGDKVVHWAYGLGAIIQLDEKELSGHTDEYYVVQMHNLTVWVPINEMGERGLRLLTPAGDFERLFDILSSPAEPLSPDRFERKTQLTGRMKEGSIASTCRVVRDLAAHMQTGKMNENDSAMLKRARSFLLEEWSVALSVPVRRAERELIELLK